MEKHPVNDIATLEHAPVLIPDDEYDRQKFIGSSNVAAIIGLGAYGQTPLTTYLAKVGEGQEVVDPEHELFLQRRKRWEGPIVQMLREEFKGEIVSVNKRYRDGEIDYLAAEIDFEWRDGDGFIQNGEIKTVSPFAYGEKHGWGDEGTDDVPVNYAAQVYHGLGVMRRQKCILAALVGLDSMLFYNFAAHAATIAEMREKCQRFWIDHVLAHIPPEPLNLEDSMRLAQRLQGRPVVVDDEIRDTVENLRQLRANRKAMEGDESEMKFQILEFIRKKWTLPADIEIEESALIMHNGKKIASYNRQIADRIDVDRLRKEQKEIAQEYTKESRSRVLRITKRASE